MKHFNFTTMKTFDDLKFNLHPKDGFDTQAIMFFDNGYGISVITGKDAYSNDEYPYECAVIKGNKDSWTTVTDTPITDDVIGFCDKDEVTGIMKQIQELSEKTIKVPDKIYISETPNKLIEIWSEEPTEPKPYIIEHQYIHKDALIKEIQKLIDKLNSM